MSDNKLLISFLRDLLQKIENGDISEENLRRVSEFFVSYKFEENKLENPFRDEDLDKYAYLGWYIYSQLQNK
jgi:hypothetical protein